MELVAITTHRYAGQTVRPGQRYKASQPLARALVAAKLSHYAGCLAEPGLGKSVEFKESEIVPRGTHDGAPEAYLEHIRGPKGEQGVPGTYETSEEKPARPGKKPRKKREYKRRDMNPKDE